MALCIFPTEVAEERLSLSIQTLRKLLPSISPLPRTQERFRQLRQLANPSRFTMADSRPNERPFPVSRGPESVRLVFARPRKPMRLSTPEPRGSEDSPSIKTSGSLPPRPRFPGTRHLGDHLATK